MRSGKGLGESIGNVYRYKLGKDMGNVYRYRLG